MGIRLESVRVRNFKSVKDATVGVGEYPVVLIGANGAGKSSFTQAFKFVGLALKNLNTAYQDYGFENIVWKKNRDLQIDIDYTFTVDLELRKDILSDFTESTDDQKDALGAGLLERIRCNISFGYAKHAIKYYGSRSGSGEEGLITGMENTPGFVQKVHHFAGILHKDGQYLIQHSTASKGPAGSTLDLNYDLSGAMKLGRILRQISTIIAGYAWLSPIRKSSHNMVPQETYDMGREGENLIAVLKTMQSNKPELFEAIEEEVRRIVPLLGDFQMPIKGPGTTLTTLGIRDRFMPGNLIYEMAHLSYGTHNALAVVTHVMCMADNGFACIEEPEAHLHPRAQEALYDFLVRHSSSTGKTVLLTSHSPVLAGISPIEALWLVTMNGEGATEVSAVNDQSLSLIVAELGVRPAHNFNSDRVVIVEGKSDARIFRMWADKLGILSDTQFIPARGWSTVEFYASADMLRALRTPPKVYLVFDGDTERDPAKRKAKRAALTRIGKGEAESFTLPMDELEGYMLDAEAIEKAFKSVSLGEGDRTLLANAKQGTSQKEALEGLLRRVLGHGFLAESVSQIASAMDAVPGDVRCILESIAARKAA